MYANLYIVIPSCSFHRTLCDGCNGLLCNLYDPFKVWILSGWTSVRYITHITKPMNQIIIHRWRPNARPVIFLFCPYSSNWSEHSGGHFALHWDKRYRFATHVTQLIFGKYSNDMWCDHCDMRVRGYTYIYFESAFQTRTHISLRWVKCYQDSCINAK